MTDKSVDAHVQRMLDEQSELSDKVGKLETFILTNPVFKQLSKERQRLMRQQYDAMSLYNNILKERVALEQ
jgi:uncharacterized protein YdcH (DUF465 family)